MKYWPPARKTSTSWGGTWAWRALCPHTVHRGPLTALRIAQLKSRSSWKHIVNTRVFGFACFENSGETGHCMKPSLIGQDGTWRNQSWKWDKSWCRFRCVLSTGNFARSTRFCAINWVVVAQKLVSVASRSPQQWLANSEIYPWTDFIGNSFPLFITGIECHDSWFRFR